MEFVSEVCKIVTAALQELSANEAELADLERKYTPPKSPYFIENIDRTAEFTAYKKHETALLEERQKVQESAERAIAEATAAYKKSAAAPLQAAAGRFADDAEHLLLYPEKLSEIDTLLQGIIPDELKESVK